MLPQKIALAQAELRSSSRRRTLLGGKIVSRDGTFSLDCVIRDLTPIGAKIDLAPERLIPKRLYLIAPKLHLAFDAEQMWRNGKMAGLKFHHSLDLANDPGAHPQFLRRIYLALCPRNSAGT